MLKNPGHSKFYVYLFITLMAVAKRRCLQQPGALSCLQPILVEFEEGDEVFDILADGAYKGWLRRETVVAEIDR